MHVLNFVVRKKQRTGIKPITANKLALSSRIMFCVYSRKSTTAAIPYIARI